MKKFLMLLVIAYLLLMPVQAEANILTLYFDELIDSTVLNNQYLGQGVLFSNSLENLRALEAYPGPLFSPPIAILPEMSGDHFNQAIFSSPVSFVSVVMGDLGADSDYIYLEAYDSLDQLIDSSSAYLDPTFYGGVELSVGSSSEDIAYVKFWGEGENNSGPTYNSVYFDNFSFGTPIPEPATMFLFGTGLLGLIGLRRLRSR